MTLPTRRLGSTDLELSVLGLGTVKIGRNQGVKYPQGFHLPDDREVDALIGLARELGINTVDTAPAYGSSEERLGRALRGQRQDWHIVTKVGEEFDQGQSHFDFSAEHCQYSLKRSLERLQTDYLDMVLIHSDGDDGAALDAGCMDALLRARDEGWVRAIGLSGKTVHGALSALDRGADVVMVSYQPQYRDEQAVIDHCSEAQRGVLIKKAFASGHLDPSDPDPIATHLKFCLAPASVTSVIAGTINPEHLRHNARCAVEAA